MAAAQKFLVMPFKKARGGIVPAEMRQASNAASAERIAASMASRFAGVVALSAMADNETGDLAGARLLASHGEIGDLSAIIEFQAEDEAEVAQESTPPEATPEAPVDEVDPPEAQPDPAPQLVDGTASLILTAPPEPARATRAVRAIVRRKRPLASSAGPLFEQESINA